MLATEERLTPKCATTPSIGRDIENRRDNSGLRSSLVPQTIIGTYEEQLSALLDGEPHKFFEIGKRAASGRMSMIRKQESCTGKNVRQFSYFRVA